jgi:DNA mismatch repair ATPase MutS
LGEVRLNLVRLFLSRPVVRGLLQRALLEYALENSPAVQNYVKRIARVTGLPEEVVKRSRPVRNYIRSLLGV